MSSDIPSSFEVQSRDIVSIIMAGGMGKRMKSELPKVLHKIHNEPMIVRIIKTVLQINPIKIYIIVGKYKGIISETIAKYIENINIIEYIDQPEALGTGHALQCCLPQIRTQLDSNILILSGDTPLISVDMLNMLINNSTSGANLSTINIQNPYGYGRIIQHNNIFEKIVEEKDCSQDEQQIKLVNAGLYIFLGKALSEYLPLIENNNTQGEYYLTDIFEMIKNGISGDYVSIISIPENMQYQLMGVNTPEQLQEVEEILIN